MKFIATCKLGLEALVARELRERHIELLSVEDARVCFEGGYEEMAQACLWLRTAERVLLVMGSFPAYSFDELFEGTKVIRWKEVLGRDANIHVNGKSAKSTLFSVSDCQSIVKKAIVENLKTAYRVQTLPETGREVIVEVGLLKDVATLTLDCCGAGLSRRGYRTFNVPAPISETLGAAIVLLSRWRHEEPLIDPMCGSGTMPIEAAMQALNIAPGRNRTFAAEDWPFLPAACFDTARAEAEDAVRRDLKLQILGSDIDPHAIDLCKKHAKKAGIMVDWAACPLRELNAQTREGVIVCNPPYGERMLEKKEAEALYREMRSVFDMLPDWRINVITSHPKFEQLYGKRADKRRKLSNGGMPCTLYQYFARNSEKDN